MIPRHTVTRTIVAMLRSAIDTGARPVAVAHQRAPMVPPQSYVVVRSAPGSQRTGPQTKPVDWMNLRIDLVAVATASTDDLAATEAERITDLSVAALFNYTTPIGGDGWAVTGRAFVSDSGVIGDANEAGATANITTTIDLYIVAAASVAP